MIQQMNGDYIDTIIKIVSAYNGLSQMVMLSKTRKREIVLSRQMSMFFSKRYTRASLSTIGEKHGNKDHATVLHAVHTINDLIDTDRHFSKIMDDLNGIIVRRLGASKKDVMVCRNCGSEDVIVQAFIFVNSKKFVRYNEEYEKNAYCTDCKTTTTLIPLTQWEVLVAEKVENYE